MSRHEAISRGNRLLQCPIDDISGMALAERMDWHELAVKRWRRMNGGERQYGKCRMMPNIMDWLLTFIVIAALAFMACAGVLIVLNTVVWSVCLIRLAFSGPSGREIRRSQREADRLLHEVAQLNQEQRSPRAA